jgi:hypothetical protein
VISIHVISRISRLHTEDAGPSPGGPLVALTGVKSSHQEDSAGMAEGVLERDKVRDGSRPRLNIGRIDD